MNSQGTINNAINSLYRVKVMSGSVRKLEGVEEASNENKEEVKSIKKQVGSIEEKGMKELANIKTTMEKNAEKNNKILETITGPRPHVRYQKKDQMQKYIQAQAEGQTQGRPRVLVQKLRAPAQANQTALDKITTKTTQTDNFKTLRTMLEDKGVKYRDLNSMYDAHKNTKDFVARQQRRGNK